MALVGDTIQAVVKLSHPRSSQIQNVFHWLMTGVGGAADANVVTAVQDTLLNVYTVLEPYLANGTQAVELVVTKLAWVTDHWETIQLLDDILGTVFAGFAPAAAGDPLPPGVSGLGTLRTAIPKHNGRKYFAPFVEGYNDADGDASPTTVSALADAVAAYDSLIELSLETFLEPVVLRRDVAGHTPITAVSAGPIWAYQRRRKINRGV